MPAGARAAFVLGGSPFARTPVTIERTWRIRTPSAISTSIWSSSTTLVPCDEPPLVMSVAAAQALKQVLVLLPVSLRPHRDEIE